MGWISLDTHITHTDGRGQTWDRRVAFNTDTGEVVRTFGPAHGYSDSRKTSRHVGYAKNADEAIALARRDLARTFD